MKNGEWELPVSQQVVRIYANQAQQIKAQRAFSGERSDTGWKNKSFVVKPSHKKFSPFSILHHGGEEWNPQSS
jgi:hypothetical protein